MSRRKITSAQFRSAKNTLQSLFSKDPIKLAIVNSIFLTGSKYLLSPRLFAIQIKKNPELSIYLEENKFNSVINNFLPEIRSAFQSALKSFDRKGAPLTIA